VWIVAAHALPIRGSANVGELSDIIKRHPAELADLLRTTKGMSRDKIKQLAEKAKEMKTK
jgi:hypothetical protein